MLTAAELPWTMPAGPVLEDVTPRETLDAALAAFDVPGFRARQEADKARGVYRGMGLCYVVNPTLMAPRSIALQESLAPAMRLAG